MANVKLKDVSHTAIEYRGIKSITLPSADNDGVEVFVQPTGTLQINTSGTYDVTMLETVVIEGAIQTIPAAGLSF